MTTGPPADFAAPLLDHTTLDLAAAGQSAGTRLVDSRCGARAVTTSH